MSKNLRRFSTLAEYESATLNYPAVSWVEGTDTVYFDASAPVVNDEIMIGFNAMNAGDDIVLYNSEAEDTDFTSITVNDVAIDPIVPVLDGETEADTDYVVKYGSNYTSVTDAFSGDLGITSDGLFTLPSIEMYLPPTITAVDFLPNNEITALVIDSTTPPSVVESSILENIVNIYVPDEAVNTYTDDASWIDVQVIILPISEYQGNLPI